MLSPCERYIIDVMHENVDGFLGIGEMRELYRRSCVIKKGVIVEIGSWKGKSTCALALPSVLRGNETMVYSVDPMEGKTVFPNSPPKPTSDVFDDNIKKWHLAKYIVQCRSKSCDVCDTWGEIESRAIDLLFVDGDHTKKEVLNDLRGWVPHVKTGGIVLMHDHNNKTIPGVKRGVDAFMKMSDSLKVIGSFASMLILQKQ